VRPSACLSRTRRELRPRERMASEHPKVPAEIESGIQNFDHGKLKHAETAEKNPLPSSESECTYLTASHR